MRIGLLGPVTAGPDGAPAPGGPLLRGMLARLALDAGRPVGTDTLVDALWGDEPLSVKAAEYLRFKYKKPGAAFVGVAHRLDRPVSGVVALAKTSKALSRLNEMFRDNTVHKTYWALVGKQPEPAAGHLVHWLPPGPGAPGTARRAGAGRTHRGPGWPVRPRAAPLAGRLRRLERQVAAGPGEG